MSQSARSVRSIPPIRAGRVRAAFRRAALVLAGLSALALSGCDKDEEGNGMGPGSTAMAGDVILKIVDVNTRQAVDGATVSLLGSESGTTDDEGKVTLKGIRSGAYFVRIEKAGYETAENLLEAAVKGELAPTPILVSRSYSIHRKGVTVKGRLLVRPEAEGGTRKPEGVTVELRLSGAFLAPYRTARTDEEGAFAFENLPELAGWSVATGVFTFEGRSFRLGEGMAGSAALVAGDVHTLPTAILSPVSRGVLQVLTASPVALEKGKALRIEFSAPVDTSTLKAGSIALATGSATIAFAASWSEDLRVLEIEPFQADWARGSYTLYLSDFSDEDGNALAGGAFGGQVMVSANLKAPAVGVGKVEGLKLRSTLYLPASGRQVDTNVVDYTTSAYYLSWKRAQDAVSYDLYVREGADSAWRLQQSAWTDTVWTFMGAAPAAGKRLTRFHMVVPRNGADAADFGTAATLEVKDGVKPVISIPYGIGSPGASFLNPSGETVRYQLPVTLSAPFSSLVEPLDTTVAPQLDVREGCRNSFTACDTAYAPRPVRFRWTSRNAGMLEVEVEAGKDGRNDTLTVDFSRVTDLAGNAMESATAGKPPVLRYVTF